MGLWLHRPGVPPHRNGQYFKFYSSGCKTFIKRKISNKLHLCNLKYRDCVEGSLRAVWVSGASLPDQLSPQTGGPAERVFSSSC